MSEGKPELRVVQSSDAALATLELISQARQSLAEARTLPDIRRVMEAASVAKDAAERAARLFNAERRAAEVVEAATAAANDAAAVRIEAQAKAGELLAKMREHGEREGTGRAGEERVSHAATPPPTLSELGVTRSESSRWQQVADVPPEVRAEYVEQTKATKGEVSTAGLLRHARGGPAQVIADPQKRSHGTTFSDGRLKLVHELHRALDGLPTYPPALIADLEGDDRARFHRTARRVAQWFGYLTAELRQGAAEHEFERVQAVHTLTYELAGLCAGPAPVRVAELVDAVVADDRPELLKAARDIGAWLVDLEGELTRRGAGDEPGHPEPEAER